jgi:uncharacterized protein YciI
MSRFAYFYFMKNEPDGIRRVAPEHAAYWRTQDLDDYKGGPFGDRSGGLITFEASDLAAAEHLVANDPFRLADLLADKWLKEWQPE